VTTDRLTRTVREQVALGRLLPLGGPDDAVWITESAAVRALRRACAALPGARLGEVGVTLGEGMAEGVPAAAPLGALPHLPLRIEAEFEAAADEPVPVVADRLRDRLWDAASAGLGLAVEAVDLRVTGLLEGDRPASAATDGDDLSDAADPDGEPEPGPAGVRGPAAAVEAAARAVPGVLRLTRRLAGLGNGPRVHDTEPPQAPARHVQLQIATAPGHLPLTAARHAAAAAAEAAAPGARGPVSAAVVVTEVN
jgi:hypothetical protein